MAFIISRCKGAKAQDLANFWLEMRFVGADCTKFSLQEMAF